MRAAAIDIGTNSVLLLIAEKRGDAIVSLVERATITRLGQGVDASRALAPEATARTLACLARYAEDIRAAGVTGMDRVAVVGTSAMRDAKGGEDFVASATEILGVAPRIVSGDEEARLTFSGALTGLDLPPGPVVVFDVGGGSTEIVIGDSSGGVQTAVSLNVGSVRLTERYIYADPPSEAEIAAVCIDARGELSKALRPLGDSPRLVGVAGTMTTLAAFARGIVPYDGARVHGARLSKEEIAGAAAHLAGLPLLERRTLPGLDPARADVIVAGGFLVKEILAWASASEVIISDRGVRWGLAHEILKPARKA